MEVGWTIVAGLARRAHRAGHHHRLVAADQEIEQECRLLDRIGSLDHNRPTGPAVIQSIADDAGQLDQLREREMARWREASIDGNQLGDLRQAGRPGKDGRAIEAWQVAASGRMHAHADRA